MVRFYGDFVQLIEMKLDQPYAPSAKDIDDTRNELNSDNR